MSITKSQLLIFVAVCAVIAFGITFYFNTGYDSSSAEGDQAESIGTHGDSEQAAPRQSENANYIADVKTKLVAAGDIILSRTVGVKITEAGDNTLPFHNVKDIFKEGDIAFATLDAPFYNEGPLMTEGMVFKVEPEFIEGLTISGIDVASLAGNHFGDQGQVGMKYSLDWLEQNGIKTCGAGEDIYKAHEPAIISHDGLKFAFLSYNEIPPQEYGATTATAGTAWMETLPMQEDVAKTMLEADVVIVVMHAGTEYIVEPTIQQRSFAHAAIDAGADLVLGSHPHTVQPTEIYNDKLIVYSMGNFIFDQMWSQETMEGVMVELDFYGTNLGSADFIPVIIENYNQPRIAEGSEAEVILDRMQLEASHLDI